MYKTRHIMAEAVGGDVRISPCEHRGFLPSTIIGRLTTSATTGNRHLHFGVHDANGILVGEACVEGPQPKNTTSWYYAYMDSPGVSFMGGVENHLYWARLVVPPGGYVRAWDFNRVSAADHIRLVVQGTWAE